MWKRSVFPYKTVTKWRMVKGIQPLNPWTVTFSDRDIKNEKYSFKPVPSTGYQVPPFTIYTLIIKINSRSCQCLKMRFEFPGCGIRIIVCVHGFKGSRVQGSILVPGLRLGCVFMRKASFSSGLIQNLEQIGNYLGKWTFLIPLLAGNVEPWTYERLPNEHIFR